MTHFPDEWRNGRYADRGRSVRRDGCGSFHTQVIGSPTGGGLPVPQLGVGIVPPAGVPDPGW